jgi:peroxiredoxin
LIDPFKFRSWPPGRATLTVCLCLGLYSGITAAGELLKTPVATPPAFRLQDLSGQARHLDDFAGTVVLVNFWASWCRPCIDEIPSIRRLNEVLKDTPFTVVAVNVGESQRRVEAATKRLGIDFPVLLDETHAVFESWRATVLPAARIIDCSGNIRYRVEGPVEWDRANVISILKALTTEGCKGQTARQKSARN